MREIIDDLRKITNIPIIYFANNGATLLDLAVQSGANVLGLDWRVDISAAAAQVGRRAVQGNLDPLALFLPEQELEARVARLLQRADTAYGHIFNLGHGVVPQTDPGKVGFLVDTVHRLSATPAQ